MFRFTIRDLLWLTALVAMAIGWWLDHARTQRFDATVASLLRLRGISVAEMDGAVWVIRSAPNESWANSRSLRSTDNRP
jgi:hypothetical protein